MTVDTFAGDNAFDVIGLGAADTDDRRTDRGRIGGALMVGGGLVASPPGLSPGLPRLVVAVVFLWTVPVLIGGMVNAVAGAVSTGETALGLLTFALFLIFSPVLSWVGWVIALPAVWWLLSRGLFGWLPAAAVGLGSGIIAGAITDTELAIPFGIVSLLALRLILAFQRPPPGG